MSLPLIVTAGKYASVYDVNGDEKVIGIPPNRGVLFYSDGSVYWEDGSDEGILLDSLKEIDDPNAAMTHLGGFTGQGSLVRFGGDPTNGTSLVPVSIAGVIKWATLPDANIPTSGSGIIVRQPVVGGVAQSPAFLGGGGTLGQGVPCVLDDGSCELAVTGTEKQVLTIVSGVPTFADPFIGGGATAVAGGNAVNGLAGIDGRSTLQTVAYSAPQLNLVNSLGTVATLNGGTWGANLATTGVPGLDVGVAQANHWYNLFIVYDGTANSFLVFSQNFDKPDPTVLANYPYYVFVGGAMNYNGALVQYRQIGRRFYINPTEVFKDQAINTTWGWSPAFTGFVPPTILKTVSGLIGGSGSGTTANTIVFMLLLAQDLTGLGEQFVNSNNVGPAGTGFVKSIGQFWDVPISDSANPRIAWVGYQSITRARVVLTGYTI